MSEPVHIISPGAGVQSSTMALMAAAGEITPMPIAAIFADTQAEPESVYRFLDFLEKKLPFPVLRVTRGSLEQRELRVLRSAKSGKHYRKSGIPLFLAQPNGSIGIIPRKCTGDFKIAPITKEIRKYKSLGVVQWFGISLDEIQRMKESQISWITHRYPLIDARMSRHDCLRWMEKHGFPKPPRSACVFCPYHHDREWARLKKEEPEEFQRAVEFERLVQQAALADETTEAVPFLHDSCKALAEVDFSTEEERGQFSLFNAECSGMCGV